ncbi:MAG: hypothetical protein IT204_19055, partial [Fimbriimonadaceae bacterium]|nr:hypothetical protein [Fimbriimonadaceae bacterium]
SIDQAAALTLTALSPYAELSCILTSDQGTVASGDFVAVNWTNATRTLTGLSWSSGNPTRLTVSTGYGGYYDIEGLVAWDASSAGQRYAALFINGTIKRQSRPQNALVSAVCILQIVFKGRLAAGDYIELMGYQDSGADRTYKAASSGAQVSLSGVRLFV